MNSKQQIKHIKSLLKASVDTNGEIKAMPFDVAKAYFAFRQKPLPAKTTIFELDAGHKGKFFISIAKHKDFEAKKESQSKLI